MKDTNLNIRITKELKKKLQDYTKKKRISTSKLLTDFITVVTLKNK